MKKLLYLIVFFSISKLFFGLTFYTHLIDPFSHEEENKILSGYAVDLVKEMMKIRRINYSIEILPFLRGMNKVKNEPNNVFFIVALREERKNDYKWVGPLVINEVYFYKKKLSDINPKNLTEMKKLKRIGVMIGNADDIFLTESGFENLDRSVTQGQALLKLVADRVDVIPIGSLVLKSSLEEYNINPLEIEKIDVKLYDSELYLVFSKNIPDDEIEKWQNALDIAKINKEKELYKKYIE